MEIRRTTQEKTEEDCLKFIENIKKHREKHKK